MAWNAHVWVKWNEQYPKGNGADWNWLKEWPEVKQAWSTMGDWDGCLWLNVSTPDELENFVWKKLRSKNWIAETKSVWARSVWNQ